MLNVRSKDLCDLRLLYSTCYLCTVDSSETDNRQPRLAIVQCKSWMMKRKEKGRNFEEGVLNYRSHTCQDCVSNFVTLRSTVKRQRALNELDRWLFRWWGIDAWDGEKIGTEFDHVLAEWSSWQGNGSIDHHFVEVLPDTSQARRGPWQRTWVRLVVFI